MVPKTLEPLSKKTGSKEVDLGKPQLSTAPVFSIYITESLQ